MKAKLEFDLDDPSDRKAHKRCVSATDAYLCLHDIDNMLRDYTKYSKGIDVGDKIALPEGWYTLNSYESQLLHTLAEIIRGKVNEITKDNRIDIEDLE